MRARFAIGLAFTLAAASGRAEVASVAPTGFEVRHRAAVKATAPKVWESLVAVGSWWNPQHTWSGDAKNLSIDARAGGCFCEKLPDGGVQHMTVVFVDRGKLLRLAGALGPLQAAGLTGSMTWEIKPAPEGAVLELAYAVGGYMPAGFDKLAPIVDHTLGEQFERLTRLIETGSPAPTPGR